MLKIKNKTTNLYNLEEEELTTRIQIIINKEVTLTLSNLKKDKLISILSQMNSDTRII